MSTVYSCFYLSLYIYAMRMFVSEISSMNTNRIKIESHLSWIINCHCPLGQKNWNSLGIETCSRIYSLQIYISSNYWNSVTIPLKSWFCNQFNKFYHFIEIEFYLLFMLYAEFSRPNASNQKTIYYIG